MRILLGWLRRIRPSLRAWLYAGGNRRDRRQHPDRVIAALGLTDGDRVADLGSGGGYFTVRLARAVEPSGVAYAVDTDRELLEWLEEAAAKKGIANLRTVLIGADRLDLPEPVDLLFVSAAYHHLVDPVTYFRDATRYLRRGGRVAILESRGTGLLRRWFGHATPPARVLEEMREAGYDPIEERGFVEGHAFTIFRPRID